MINLDLSSINWGLIAPILIIQLILVIVALVDVLKQEMTNGPKWLWILIILFVNLLGPVIYFIFGRKKN